MGPRQQEEPVPPGKKRVRQVRVEDGHEIEEWVLVDDVAGLAWPPREQLRLLNGPLPRVDAPDKVSGRARYTHDVRLPGMLYARLLLCPRPAASVKVLDLAPARALAGVVEAIEFDLEGRPTRFLGEPIAAVAAETPELAEDGVRAIRVEYGDEPWVVSYEQAIEPGAPGVSRRGNITGTSETGNLQEASAELESCDVVVEASYSLPVQHHVCLETHGVVVDARGDEATVHASTQGTSIPSGEAAPLLDLPAGRVTTIVQHMGGGFGSKFGIGPEGLAACRLAKATGRPVHLMLTRADEFLMAGNRSGSRQHLIGGVTRDGVFQTLVQRISKLGGVGGGSHPDGAPYIYRPLKHYIHSQSVLTNTDSSRAMRAPGHPQASFAMESMMDELAYAISIDPLEFRKRHVPDPIWAGQLDRVAREIGWSDHPHRTAPGPLEEGLMEGIGFAIATWGGGGRGGTQVEVRIEPDGSVRVSVGTQDLGTGTRTYVAAIVAEELGLPLASVKAEIGDSRYGNATPSGGSTTTASLAPAVKDAANGARERFLERAAEALGGDPARYELSGGRLRDGSGRQHEWKDACAVLGASPVVAIGEWRSDLAGSGVHGAQAARVAVDGLTGEVRVLRIVALHDSGLPLNRTALESQIRGGVIQALSYGLFEERVIDPWLGAMLSADLDNYKIASCGDIPEITALIDDEDQRQVVIGSAEAHIIPGHSAIANAVYNACGVRVRDLPITADKVLMGLEARRSREENR